MENMKNEVDFLPADKRQRFLQSDTIVLDMFGQACPSVPPKKFAIFLQFLKIEASDKVDFFTCR